MWDRFRGNKVENKETREDLILKRTFASQDRKNCWQKQATATFERDMCLFREKDPHECRKPASKAEELKTECKSHEANIEQIDRKLFKPGG